MDLEMDLGDGRIKDGTVHFRLLPFGSVTRSFSSDWSSLTWLTGFSKQNKKTKKEKEKDVPICAAHRFMSIHILMVLSCAPTSLARVVTHVTVSSFDAHFSITQRRLITIKMNYRLRNLLQKLFFFFWGWCFLGVALV